MEEERRNLLPWKGKFTVSLKLPVVLLLVIFGLVPMVLCTVTVVESFRQGQIDSRMMEVQNQCQILSSKLTRTGYLKGENKDGLMDNEISTMADIYNGRIVVVNKDFRIVQDSFHLAEKRMLVAEEVIRCFQGETSSKYNREKRYFAQAFPIYNSAQDQGIDGVLVIIASAETVLSVVDTVADRALLVQLMVFLALLLIALMVITMLMRPFAKFQGKLNHVAEGALDTDISADWYKETRDISRAVERTLSTLKEVDQSRQEFVSNVSHELKTPITSIRVLADSLMGMEDVPAELYREFMEDISVEIDRESKIIDDLLTLVRMDKSKAELNITQVNINGFVKQILKRLRPIANRRKIELIFESIREVTADVDEMKLSLAISNLVENAIKYNQEEGWVRVTLDADHKFFYVKVADSGIGIPEEEQNRIFERFYRVDKARSRETGGSGLGLSITRSVVLMHKGVIKISSKTGEGSIFTLRIPLNYIA